MIDMLRRLVWFGIVATAVCYSIFFVLGQFADFQFGWQKPIAIRDDLRPGVHQLSGIVMVPYACDQLSVQTESEGTTTFLLVFGTWQDPAVPCPEEPTPREFQTVVFAPLGVDFIATIDGHHYPTAIIPRIASSSEL